MGLADILSALCCVIALRAYVVQVMWSSWLASFIAVTFVALALYFKEQGITYLVRTILDGSYFSHDSSLDDVQILIIRVFLSHSTYYC